MKLTLNQIHDALEDLTMECICHPDTLCRISADENGLSIKSGAVMDTETVLYENYFPEENIFCDDDETLEQFAEEYTNDFGVYLEIHNEAMSIANDIMDGKFPSVEYAGEE